MLVSSFVVWTLSPIINKNKPLTEEETKKYFELIDSQLFKFTMVKISENDGGFYVRTHHLISDAWTMTLTLEQIYDNYTKIVSNDQINTTLFLAFALKTDQSIVAPSIKRR